MAEQNKTVQKGTTDNRRVETHIEENVQANATERVTTYKEEVVPMAVKKVVREKIIPVVASRIVESYENGQVISREHEVLPDHELNLTGPARLTFTPDPPAAPLPAPAPAPAPAPQAPVAPSKGIEVNSTTLLYVLLGIEGALALYLTVLKGTVLN